MKKLLLFLTVIFLLLIACKKSGLSPVGPTDIRVMNITNVQMTNVTINTYDSTFNYGTIDAGDTSEYHRFDRAYQKANISAIINGLTYKTDTAIYTWQHYLSTVKATYQIYDSLDAHRRLGIYLILESDIK